jgi:hypothetical protein
LTFLCCPLFIKGTLRKNCPSSKIKHHDILCFHSVRALTTSFFAVGFGVAGQQNGLPVMSFVRVDQTASLVIKQQTWDMFATTPLDFLTKSAESVLHDAEVCAEFYLPLNGSVWALKWCKNCKNIASPCVFQVHLRGKNTQVYSTRDSFVYLVFNLITLIYTGLHNWFRTKQRWIISYNPLWEMYERKPENKVSYFIATK